METQSILINNINGQDLLTRLDGIENAVKSLTAKTTAHKELLTRKETMQLLQISPVTLYKWTNTGKVKAYRISGRIYYKYSELCNVK